MAAPRIVVLPALLLAMAACAGHRPGGQAEPKPALKASIHANYWGGMIDRTGEALFRLDEGAYTMVAHLGGDGRIEVLFPRDARDDGFVPRGKWFRTRLFHGYYDAVPQLYSFATTRFRHPGARLDSYDGLGNGFVFLIASRRPLRFDRISEVGLWDEVDAQTYQRSDDPRQFIRSFADLLAPDSDYVIEYARSVRSTSVVTSFDRSLDCAYLSMLSYTALASLYHFGAFGYVAPFDGYDGYVDCGDRTRYAVGPLFGTVSTPTTSGAPRNPDGPSSPFHPGFRPRGDGPTLGFNHPTHRTPAIPTAGVPTGGVPASGDRDWRTYGPRAGTDGPRREFGHRPTGSNGGVTFPEPRADEARDPGRTRWAPREERVHDAPRSPRMDRGVEATHPVTREQAPSYTPHQAVDRAAPAPQPVAPAPAPAPAAPPAAPPRAPEERKPQR